MESIDWLLLCASALERLYVENCRDGQTSVHAGAWAQEIAAQLGKASPYREMEPGAAALAYWRENMRRA